MKRWLTKALGEVCSINPKLGASEAPAADSEVTFVSMAAVDEVSGSIARPELRRYSQVAKGYTPFGDNDVLFAKITPCMQNGKAAIARGLHGGRGFGSTEFHVLRPDSTVLPQWVFSFVRQPSFRLAAEASFTGSGGQQRVPADFLKTFPIPVPPLAEQERIVRLLDEADELRKLRARADRRTAALLPALFHEMFGSPAGNPLGWPVEKVGALFDEARGGAKCGPFGSALKKHEYVAAGVPVWGIPNILPNQFVEAGSLFISSKKFDELKAYAVEPGDVLFSRAGTVGRLCVAQPTVKDSIMGSNLIRLALDRRKVVPEFFSTLMTFFAKDVGHLRANIDEGAYSFMNTTVLKTLQIYVPPLPLQKSFAQRVAEIRELEAGQAASRQRLEALFQALLHRAFQGEL